MTYIGIILTFVLIENFILTQFLGLCPFIGVSKKIDSAVGMGFAVIFDPRAARGDGHPKGVAATLQSFRNLSSSHNDKLCRIGHRADCGKKELQRPGEFCGRICCGRRIFIGDASDVNSARAIRDGVDSQTLSRSSDRVCDGRAHGFGLYGFR